jgi:hypothetical protein
LEGDGVGNGVLDFDLTRLARTAVHPSGEVRASLQTASDRPAIR